MSVCVCMRMTPGTRTFTRRKHSHVMWYVHYIFSRCVGCECNDQPKMIKLMKGNALRKHSLHEKTACQKSWPICASVVTEHCIDWRNCSCDSGLGRAHQHPLVGVSRRGRRGLLNRLGGNFRYVTFTKKPFITFLNNNSSSLFYFHYQNKTYLHQNGYGSVYYYL